MHIGCYVLWLSCKSIQVVRDWELSFLSFIRTAQHWKRCWFSKYWEINNIKKNSQCVHTTALVSSLKIGNDRQPRKPLNKFEQDILISENLGSGLNNGSYNL